MARKKSKKSNFRSKWLLILAAFVILFAIFFSAYMDHLKTAVPASPQIPGWKTYTGTRFDKTHFSFDYPSNCNIVQNSNPPGEIISCSGGDIKIEPDAGAHGMGDNPYSRITTTSSDIVLGSNKWTRVIYQDATNLGNTDVVYTLTLKKNIDYLLIEVPYSNSSYSKINQDLVEKSISTFKFTQ